MKPIPLVDDIRFAAELANVITVREACQMFGKHETTVYMAINCGNVYAELRGNATGNPKSRGLWLLSLQSCIDNWGKPKGTI